MFERKRISPLRLRCAEADQDLSGAAGQDAARSTIKGIFSEVVVGVQNGLDHQCAVSLDNVVTIPTRLLERVITHPAHW
ncbi:MAG: hypothetical protein QM655_06245 [Nocardioidaceae bacterium]